MRVSANFSVPFAKYPDVVSVTQMSEMLNISEKTAYQMLKAQKIGYIKIGRTYRIPKANVIQFLHTGIT